MVEGRLEPDALKLHDPELSAVLAAFGDQTTKQLGRKADATFLSGKLVDSLESGTFVRGWR